MARSIRVVIADDHEIIRIGVRFILEHVESIRVAGEARSALELVNVTEFVQPDVVVTDVLNLDLIRQIKLRAAATRVLVLSACADIAFVTSAIQAGANGYILKQSASVDLVRAVLMLGKGCPREPVIDARLDVTARRHSDGPSDLLSDREREILALVAAGLTSSGIARQLKLSPRTVGNHRARIMAKLRVDNCVQAAAQALQLGMITLPIGRGVTPAHGYSTWTATGAA